MTQHSILRLIAIVAIGSIGLAAQAQRGGTKNGNSSTRTSTTTVTRQTTTTVHTTPATPARSSSVQSSTPRSSAPAAKPEAKRAGSNPVKPAPHKATTPRHHTPTPPPAHHAPAPQRYDHFAPRSYNARPVYHSRIDHRARVFYIDNSPYYTYAGTYYRYVPGYGYEQIYMPEGVIVSDLPYGARRVYVNRYLYYEADGMWFQPVVGGYMIVARPAATAVYVSKPSVTFSATFGF